MSPLPTQDAPGTPDVAKSGIKTFIPLENNPDVFTHLAQNLGLSPALTFYDVFSLDSNATAHIPRPVHSLILIVPAHIYHRARSAEYAAQHPYTGSGSSEPVIWIRQTIRHACGLMSLLHAALNGEANKQIATGSILDTFKRAVVPLKPDARARYLYENTEIERAHMNAARLGDSTVPSGEEENYNHFITFVKDGDGHLWELNGGMKGPVDRGVLGESEDAISERALELGVKTFLQHAGDEDVGFSIVALAPKEE